MSEYIGRKEFFGSLLFHGKNNGYLPFDEEATSIFMSGEIHEPEDEEEKALYWEFLESCRFRGILDDNWKYPHKWLDNYSTGNFLSAPIKLSLNITSSCNLRCKHCYAVADDLDGNSMPMDHIRTLFDEMARIGLFMVSIKGGEPFCHKNLIDALDYAKQKGINTTIITNGTLIDREKAARLNETSLTYLTVSLDGADEETHDYVRGKGTFEKTLESFRNLKKYFERKALLYFTLNNRNIRQIPQIFALARELKADGLRFRPVIPLGRLNSNEELILSYEEYHKAISQILSFASRSDFEVDLPKVDNPGALEHDLMNSEFSPLFGCMAGKTFAHMDSWGNLYPCQYMEAPEFLAGNVFESSFKEVWDNGKIFKTLRNLSGNDLCNECEHFLVCKGGCRARALLLGAQINDPDPWCAIVRDRENASAPCMGGCQGI